MRHGWQDWAGAAIAASIVLGVTPAHGIITQVDGLVLPTNGNLQAGLDQSVNNGGEGVAGAIDDVNDAAVYPEVFLIPKNANGTFKDVEFFDVLEGAGYENTFGWYNVEDPTRLYGVLTCDGDDAPTNHEPGDRVTVSFQNEFTAGRYLGGFVGFFLVSENDSADDCGEPNDLGTESDFVVYTEAQLNGDGNYVHYLIYESATQADTYYFGFEDLWRGGDNDFEDMLIRVKGLIQPCVPEPEICDGLDNNCDGLEDNDPVDAGGECSELPGNQPGVGICEPGTLVCEAGALVCQGEVGPTTELCDNIDNDCDGLIDGDDPNLTDPRLGQDCGETAEGECTLGETSCVLGVVTCLGGVGPSLEFCDSEDDDCDGVTDGSVPAEGTPQSCATDAECPAAQPYCLPSTLTGTSVCAAGPADAVGNCPIAGSTCPGVRRCLEGAIQCVPTTGGTDEVCDGADNNCNGLVDEGDPGGGAACGPNGADGLPISLEMAGTGQCRPGVEHCVGGRLQCVGGRAPTEEICDGLDNDCDGTGDQTAACPDGSVCVEGKCAEPCGSGEFPCPNGLICIEGFCLASSSNAGGAPTGTGGAQAGGPGSEGGASDGTGGTRPPSGTGNTPGQGADEENAWGLATGGGGLACTLSGTQSSGTALLFGLGGLALALRRRRAARAARNGRAG